MSDELFIQQMESIKELPVEKHTLRSLRKLVLLADNEIKEWRGFLATVKKEIKRREKKNALKAGKKAVA